MEFNTLSSVSTSHFAPHAIALNTQLATRTHTTLPQLPEGYAYMNPFANGSALAISSEFYQQYYADSHPRRMILGINPGRHGAGLTGVPFTDSKRLDILGIDSRGIVSHEPSAVFVYALIDVWGGAAAFYRDFYINSPLPLGLIRHNERGNMVNANYYDHKDITNAVTPLIVESMQSYIAMPLLRDVAWCWGQGQNFAYLQRLNAAHHYFERLVPLPHPRYVIQYKSKEIKRYIRETVETLSVSTA